MKDVKRIVVGIAGNPNSGKTTIFNALTGSRQKVGNWGGVTVEKKEGYVDYQGYRLEFVDLPGTYSLTAYSLEEIIARRFIVEEKPDVIVDVIDAGNLERNLYLTVQLVEMGAKCIFVLNMADMAEKMGLEINADVLGTLLGGPVLFTVGHKEIGVKRILDHVISVYEQREAKTRHIHVPYGKEIEDEIKKLQERLRKYKQSGIFSTRWFALKLIEGDREVESFVAERLSEGNDILAEVKRSRAHLKNVFGDDPENIIVDRRYGFISGALQECLNLKTKDYKDVSQKIDSVLTNKILGIPLLFFFIWMMFQLTFRVGEYPTELIDKLFGYIRIGFDALLPEGIIKSLIIDGILQGIGGVVVFLPNILILFFVISIIEDTGYMARAAFVMDRIMHFMGLHGKSFISMIMGFGCNVPAILSTRTLENKNDRILTILINPLMSCSARLPVYVLIAGTFFGKRAGNVIFSIYGIGVILALLIGRLFRKVLFKGESEPFVMELPPYRLPTIKSLLIHMWERAVVFLKRMGTVILVGSLVVWFLNYFPMVEIIQNLKAKSSGKERVEEVSFKNMSPVGSEEQERPQSLMTIIGRGIEPVFKPLGFSWREGVALISGFFAKEIIVSTLSVLYGGDEGEEVPLSTLIKEKSGLNPFTAYGFLLFVLIYTPCLATVAAIGQETGSVKWTLFAISYEIGLAWVVAFIARLVGLLVM